MEIKLKNQEKYLNINLYEIRTEENIKNNNSLLDAFFFDCQCALFLVDTTNYQTLNSIISLFLTINGDKYPHLKKIIVETKSDIDPKIPSEEFQKFINNNPEVEHIKISSKNGFNIDELLLKIYNEVNSPKKESIPINIVERYKLDEMNKKHDKTPFSLTLVGDSGVGKTSFMTRYSMNIFRNIFISTIGSCQEMKTLKIKDKGIFLLTLWDTAGQERYKSLPKKYLQNTDGVLLLFDLSDIETFENVSSWMNQIDELRGKNVGEEGKNERDVVIYLIGNKIDFNLNDEIDIQKVEGDTKKIPVTKKEKEELSKKLGVKYFEISCKWNLNIDEIMARIALEIISKKKFDNNSTENVKLTNISGSKDEKEGCCSGKKEKQEKKKKK